MYSTYKARASFGYKVADYCNVVKRSILLACLIFWAVGLFASPVYIGLVSFDGTFVNGIPTYPYSLVAAGSPPFWAMCDDYYHDGTPGDQWLANLTNLGTGNPTNLRFASFGLVAYEEVGWIFLQTFNTPTSQWPDMNFAVWHIFNPTVVITPTAQRWINLAMANYQYGDYTHVYIATPLQINASPTGDQEFISTGSTTVRQGDQPSPNPPA